MIFYLFYYTTCLNNKLLNTDTRMFVDINTRFVDIIPERYVLIEPAVFNDDRTELLNNMQICDSGY
jgi:hypothetical protein